MSAEVLREAAALMRARAKVATPGPWVVPGADDEYVGPADVVGDGIPGERYVICEHAGIDAEHIASWHPTVALAFAVLLDGIAEVGEVRGDWDHWQQGIDALAAARAYLGRADA